MSKIDVTVTLSATFNTGNFGNVRPEVSLTKKDVEQKDLSEEYNKLLEVAEAMFGLQTHSLMNEVRTSDEGIRAYMRALEGNTDRMLEIIDEYTGKEG